MLFMRKIAMMLLLLLALFVADLLSGSVWIEPSKLLELIFQGDTDPIVREIILNFRLPKALTALAVGSALSVAGLLMQTLFRNPLAGPDVLGVNSGAGLGVAIATMFGSSISIFGEWGLITSAVLGALSVLLLVLLISTKIPENISLLITGIMIGNIAGSVIAIIQSISNPDAIKLFIVWTFGSLSSVSWREMGVMMPLIFSGLLIAYLLQKHLNSMLLGENYARALGVPMMQVRFWIILSTALLAGTATAFTGPIGFIGVTVPHIARGWMRTTDHGRLIPASLFCGASLMLLCDILSQLPGLNITLPVNSVTALFGAPIIIWILFRNRGVYFK
ncbi:MAG: FecCD family ABC transporter permease [Bacteroidales bacterium]